MPGKQMDSNSEHTSCSRSENMIFSIEDMQKHYIWSFQIFLFKVRLLKVLPDIPR